MGGTLNVLEAVRPTSGVKAVIVITSDKCYQNVEWVWGYRENDRLGGDDPYSASKACAEIACRSYVKSFFNDKDSPNVCSVRAGNVIGGGDWAADRIVPDCVRAWSQGHVTSIRSPEATRPWQHVLEPLSGYLWLGANLLSSNRLHGEAFNFGPDQEVNQSVAEICDTFAAHWGKAQWKHEKTNGNAKESTLLKLSCDKALSLLTWHPVLSFQDTIRMTSEWYKTFYEKNADMYDFTREQIKQYVDQAESQNLVWARKGKDHD